MIDQAFIQTLLPPPHHLARCVGFLMTCPPFSGKLAPIIVKIAASIVLWFASAHGQWSSMGAIPAAVLTELAIGLLLGFFILLTFLAFDIAAELTTNGMGLSFPGAFDPSAASSSGPVAGLIATVATFCFLTAGGLENCVSYLFQSFEAIRSTDAAMLKAISQTSFEQASTMMMLGIKASAILWATLLLANLLLLVSSRLAGGMNLMSSGLPILLMIGAVMLSFFLVPTINGIISSLPQSSPRLIK